MFTTSLKETGNSANERMEYTQYATRNIDYPAAFEYLYTADGSLIPDVVISTISFAMGGINPDGPTTAGWNVSAMEALGVPLGDYVVKGQVVAIAMVMKKRREIIYEGERARVAKIFFMNGQQCRTGDRLIGIVPKPLKKRG